MGFFKPANLDFSHRREHPLRRPRNLAGSQHRHRERTQHADHHHANDPPIQRHHLGGRQAYPVGHHQSVDLERNRYSEEHQRQRSDRDRQIEQFFLEPDRHELLAAFHRQWRTQSLAHPRDRRLHRAADSEVFVDCVGGCGEQQCCSRERADLPCFKAEVRILVGEHHRYADRERCQRAVQECDPHERKKRQVQRARDARGQHQRFGYDPLVEAGQRIPHWSYMVIDQENIGQDIDAEAHRHEAEQADPLPGLEFDPGHDQRQDDADGRHRGKHIDFDHAPGQRTGGRPLDHRQRIVRF